MTNTTERQHQTTDQIEKIISDLKDKPYANHSERLPDTVLVCLDDLREILLEHGVISAIPHVSYFSHDGENFEFHDTREAAIREAESAIEYYQDKLGSDEGHDIYSDGNFNQISYGIVLRSSTYTITDVVTEKHHESGDFTQFAVGTEILKTGLNGLADTKDHKLILDHPAQVGGAVFREGIAWETVIGAAKRLYHQNQNTKKPKPVLSPRQLLQIAMGELLVVPRTPSIEHLNSMALRDRHDFGMLDTKMQDSIRGSMVQMYEEATGQGFYKLGQEEYMPSAQVVAVDLSPEQVESYKKELTEANKIYVKGELKAQEDFFYTVNGTKKFTGTELPVIAMRFEDPVDAIAHAFLNNDKDKNDE